MEEERAVLLSAFVQDFGAGVEKKLQQDMVAHYLQCGAQERVRSCEDEHLKSFNLQQAEQSFLGCLEQLSCAYHHPKLDIPPAHKRIAAV